MNVEISWISAYRFYIGNDGQYHTALWSLAPGMDYLTATCGAVISRDKEEIQVNRDDVCIHCASEHWDKMQLVTGN